jgi:hypothetical protein
MHDCFVQSSQCVGKRGITLKYDVWNRGDAYRSTLLTFLNNSTNIFFRAKQIPVLFKKKKNHCFTVYVLHEEKRDKYCFKEKPKKDGFL